MADLIERLRAALVGRYDVQQELGAGGMARVFAASDPKHRRRVALKVLKQELGDAVGIERFLREIEVAAGLHHPHILPLFDSGDAGGHLYFVMPFVEGESLRNRLAREKQLPVEDALLIAREVADALSYAHSRGIVHRDIKPENILLENGHALVADFGIARLATTVDAETLTATGVAIGTPAYMSPEQAAGDREVDGRSDLYSLGCVVFEMLTGQPPFTGVTVDGILRQHLTAPPPPLHALRPGVPAHVAGALERALAKTPADRFSTAQAFTAALQTPAPAARWRRPFSRRARIGAGAALAVSLAVLFWAGAVARPGSRYAVPNPRQSFLVLPFRVAGDDPSLRWLSEGSVNLLALGLEGWHEIQTVDWRRVLALSKERGVDPATASLDEALALARAARVGTLVFGEVTTYGGTVEVSARVYDVGTKRPVRGPIRRSATLGGDLRVAFDEIAGQLLDVGGARGPRPNLRAATTASLAAYREYLSGLGHLYRWELGAAADRFQAALEHDSTFALAYHHLAVTRAWQGLDSETELSANALRHGTTLPARARRHVLAFNAFQQGDLETARAEYRALVGTDSSDAEAWFHLGDVEFHDWDLARDSSGWYAPRADWNLALAAFLRSVQLDPSFQLGYGHTFDIYRGIMEPSCRSFMAPTDVTQRQAAEVERGQVFNEDSSWTESTLSFCPRWKDSTIAWVHSPASVSEADTRTIRERAIAFARRWTQAVPDLARPHAVLRSLYLDMRNARPRSVGDSALLLARLALAEQEAELAVSPDSTPWSLARLAALYLATGNHQDAAKTADLVFAAMTRPSGDSAPAAPMAVANVLLSYGQPSRLLEHFGRWRGASGGKVFPGGVLSGRNLAQMRTVEALGASGGPEEPVRRALAEIRAWIRSFPPDQRGNVELVSGVGPGLLVLGRDAVRAWLAEADSVPTMWRAYLAAADGSIVEARRLFDRAWERLKTRDYVIPAELYTMGHIARLVGRDSAALDLWGQLDAWAFDIEYLDPGWALLSRSYLDRAQVYEVLGDAGQALRFYERFITLWVDAEPALQPLVRQAAEGVRRVRGGG